MEGAPGLRPKRKTIATALVGAGLSLGAAGAWVGWGLPAGLAAAGAASALLGLMFVDVDEDERGDHGESAP
jgi:hypothetical protein